MSRELAAPAARDWKTGMIGKWERVARLQGCRVER